MVQAGAGVAKFTSHSDAGLLAMTARNKIPSFPRDSVAHQSSFHKEKFDFILPKE
jgi:hypothetical protein